jgi:hypothetical protein
MKSRHGFLVLVLLLCAQLLAAGLLYRAGLQPAEGYEARPLLDTAASEVDRLVIGDGETDTVLVRQAEGWCLPALGDLPADSALVQSALEQVAATRIQWPVTTTAASHERFEVAADDYQRKLQLFSGDRSVGGFYLGTAPGFRLAHLRGLEDDDVYVVEMNVSDLPANSDDWLDKTLLAVSAPRRIEAEDFALIARDDGSWVLSDPAPDPEAPAPALDADAAGQLAAALESLRVQGIADPLTAPGEAADRARVIRVDSADGSLKYRFYALDGDYFVQRDDLATVFRLSRYDHDRIAGVGMADLAVQEPVGEDDNSPQQKP